MNPKEHKQSGKYNNNNNNNNDFRDTIIWGMKMGMLKVNQLFCYPPKPKYTSNQLFKYCLGCHVSEGVSLCYKTKG